ncbi:MAG TPA: LysM domain-containing protein, partial [Flavobacteriales bacterium]|nr:LysM domain-containing protein [Flavobacteriales bacterium]
PIDPAKLFDLEAGKLRDNCFQITPRTFQTVTAQATGYRVRRGDTLYAISRRTGVPVSRLCKLNRISANNTLRVGQYLKLR